MFEGLLGIALAGLGIFLLVKLIIFLVRTGAIKWVAIVFIGLPLAIIGLIVALLVVVGSMVVGIVVGVFNSLVTVVINCYKAIGGDEWGDDVIKNTPMKIMLYIVLSLAVLAVLAAIAFGVAVGVEELSWAL